MFTELQGQMPMEDITDEEIPNWMLSLLPLVIVVLLLNVVKTEAVWSLLIGVLSIMILNPRKHKQFISSINDGAKGSVMAILNTSAAVGFGAVIAVVLAFNKITSWLLNVSNNPLAAEGLAVQVMAIITGSASGGMGIALGTLGDTFVELSQASGISPEAFHRIASVASGSSIFPNNGALLTLITVTGLSLLKLLIKIYS